MKSKTLFLIFFVILTLTLLSSFAAAEKFEVIPIPVSYDFLVSTAPTTTACQCGETSFPISITNIGSYTTIFSLSSDDSRIDFSQPTITLQPGEHRQVMASRNVACTASGNQDVSIIVDSSFQFAKDVKTTLVFSDCQNTKFAFDKVNLNESVCKPFDTTLFITNDGTFSESYTIEPLDGIVTLSAGSVNIPAGQTAAITANYNLPCDLYGVYDLEYRVNALNAQKSYTIKQTVSIPYDYDFDLRAVQQVNFCAQDSKELVLELENKNNFSNDFKFDIDAPNYASVGFPEVNGKKTDVLSVDANTIVRLNITLSPDKKDVGRDVVDVAVTDKFGDLTKELSVNLTANNCYDLSTAFWSPKDKNVCGGDFLQVPFTLINNGDSDGKITLDAQGIKYVYFEEKTHEVASHSEKEVFLTINMTDDIWGDFPVTLNSYDGDELINSHKFNLVSHPKDFCYRVQPTRDVYSVVYDEKNFSINVENTGLREGKYFIDLSSKNNTFDSFAQSISLKPSQDIWLLVNISSPQVIGSEKNVSLTLFEVGSGTSYTYPLTIKITDRPWLQRTFWSAWDAIYYADSCLLVSILLAVLVLIFALMVIFRSYKKRVYKTPKFLLTILIVILILAAAAIYVFKGLPYVYTSYDLDTNSTTHLLIEEDSPLTIDLTEYFFDPDNNIVEYGVSSIDSEILTHEVDNASLTLSPSKDYNGETMIMLFATDAYGLTAESRQIRVDILPVEDYTYSELYFKVCMYINWLLLLILAIFMFLFFAYKKDSAKKQKTLSQVVVVRSEDASRVPSDNKKSKKNLKKSAKKVASKKNTSKKSSAVKKSSKKSSSKK